MSELKAINIDHLDRFEDVKKIFNDYKVINWSVTNETKYSPRTFFIEYINKLGTLPTEWTDEDIKSVKEYEKSANEDKIALRRYGEPDDDILRHNAIIKEDHEMGHTR